MPVEVGAEGAGANDPDLDLDFDPAGVVTEETVGVGAQSYTDEQRSGGTREALLGSTPGRAGGSPGRTAGRPPPLPNPHQPRSPRSRSPAIGGARARPGRGRELGDLEGPQRAPGVPMPPPAAPAPAAGDGGSSATLPEFLSAEYLSALQRVGTDRMPAVLESLQWSASGLGQHAPSDLSSQSSLVAKALARPSAHPAVSHSEGERLIAFTDAVVAVAITLLILPLMEHSIEVNFRERGTINDNPGEDVVGFKGAVYFEENKWTFVGWVPAQQRRRARPLQPAPSGD